MRDKRRPWVVGMLALLLLSSAFALRAEVSGDSSEHGFYIIILGIIEDPDPIPTITWQLVLENGGGEPLNIDGAARNDGRPDVAYDPQTGWPIVTWAYSAGSDYDVAVNEWTGDGWGENTYLTSSALDELDPRAYIDSSGRAYIVWWKSGGVEKIHLVSREAGAEVWKNPDLVINGGRRPSVTRHGSDVVVAYERNRAGGGQEIAVAFIGGDGSTFVEVVADTDRTEPLDAIVHSHGELLWVDWKHSNAAFAYSVLQEAGWSPAATMAWTDHSWIGEEVMRRMIRSEVLSR